MGLGLISESREEVYTKSGHFNSTCVTGSPKLGEIKGANFLGQSYMAQTPYSRLSMIRHVGIGMSSSAFLNHTVTISVLIEAVTFFNSLCASHSVS
jgi:hypothetical protein